MRNLKKILALVLALIMSLSLMATAGAAQFPDVDDSNPYKTAIDVLDELKVFQGFEDGTFKPTDTLNRAQAAVLVYRIATGDVENKYLDNYTYMQQSKFTDLDGYNWAKGYINYCQNAGIVVGTSATTFNPGAPVTGYQLMVMLLRTLGYGKAGEFADPKGWELQTATIAERENITKNVTSGDFGAPAPRQMVAEILFRGLLTETVEYSALVPGGYTKSGETLGMREFGLEKVSGVVMANEWANINDGGDSVLAAGTTEMLVDGKSVTVNKGTELDAVGLTYNAYIANGEGSTKRALTLEAGDNTVAFNEGKATGPDTDYSENREWASIQKLADTESISIKDSTEFFVNYDQAWNEDVTSDYRISYAIAKTKVAAVADWAAYVADLQVANQNKYPGHSISTRTINVNWDVNGDNVVDNTDTVECWYIAIRPDNLINTIDQDIMEEIFYSADRLGDNTDGTNTILQNYAIGEVYVGTTSMKDYSDTMSWKSFKTEYFNDTKTSRRFTSAENGESLRVIDNNNDGTAEYVLKIKYTMDQVTGTYKDAPELNGFRVAAKYKDNNLSMDGEFVAGDVVVYTVIDDKLTMWPAEVLTDSIKTKTFKNITVTTEGGEVKGQSGIENLTGMDQLIMNMNDKTQYNMYLDRFGFVRAYALAQGSKYALLTEMYPSSNQNHNYVQTGRVTAEMKMGEADIDEFNVANKDGSVFYSGYAWTSRLGRYYNTDLNYLQPAIAHLGLTKQYEGSTVSAIANPASAYTLVEWARTVWQMVANPDYPTPSANEYGVFEYGAVKYDANGQTGQLAVDEANSFSFTNVAAYTMDDDNNVTLNTASKLFIDQNGEQVYYYVPGAVTVDGKTYGTYELKLTEKWWNDNTATLFAGKTFKTALADGTLAPVYAVDYVQLNREDVKAGVRHFTIPADYTTNFNASNNGYVDATVNTEFYIVMPDNIIYKVGYDELPTIKAANVRAAYAVAKNTTAADNGRDYWVADVIVIEVSGLEHAFDSISLMYSNPFETSSSVRWIDSLNNKWKVYQPDSDKLAEMQVVPSSVVNNDPDNGWGNHAWRGDDYGFYGLKQVELQEEGELTAKVVELITKDYNKYGIYAGTVQRIKGILNSSGYIDVDLSGNPYNGTLVDYPNVKHITARDVPVYRIDGNSADGLTLSESDAYNEVYLGDQIIWVCEQGSADKFDKVAFIVDLGTRTKGGNADYNYTADQWLWDEYNAIITEQTYTDPVVTRSPVTFNTALTGTEEITFSYGEGDYAVNKTVKAGDADTSVSFMVPDNASGNTFHFTAKVSAGVALAAIVPVDGSYKLANSSWDAATSTYTIYMVKAVLANAANDGIAPQANDVAGVIYTVSAAQAVAAEAAGFATITNDNAADAVAVLDELKAINNNKITAVDEVVKQLDTTEADSLANKLSTVETDADTAKANAKTSISALIANYSKYDYVQKAADALNAAIKKCLTAAQVAEYITAGATGNVNSSTKTESIALKNALAQAAIDESIAAGDAAAAETLKNAKTPALAAVTTLVGSYGDYPAVKAAAEALTKAINACTVVTGTDDEDGNKQVDAVDTYYATGDLVSTNKLVQALQAAVDKATADAGALTALNNAKTAAKSAVDTWIDSTIGGDSAKEAAVKAVKAVADATKAVTDAIDACATPTAVSAIVASAGAGTVVETQTQVAALKTAIQAAAADYDLSAGKTAAKAAVTTACKGFDAVTEVAAAKKALVEAIEACDDATALEKYWNGTALTSDALVTALTGAVTTALSAAKTAAKAELTAAANAAKDGLDASADASKITAIESAATTASGDVDRATTKSEVDTAKNNGLTAIESAKS